MEEWNQKIQPLTGLTMFSREEHVEVAGLGVDDVTYYGLRDNAGTVILPAEYASFGYLMENKIVAKKLWMEKGSLARNYSVGVVSNAGEVIYPFHEDITDIVRMDAIVQPETGKGPERGIDTIIIEVKSNDPDGGLEAMVKQGLFDYNLKPLVPIEYNDISFLKNGYYLLRKYDKTLGKSLYGLYKYGTGITIPARYTTLKTVSDGDKSTLFAVRNPDMYYGLMDGDGNKILPFLYADITSQYQEKYFAVSIFKSEQSYRSAQKSGLLFAPTEGAEHWDQRGYDQSNVPAYIDAGVVDRNGNALTSFQHDKSRKIALELFELSTWNGKREIVWPFGKPTSGPVEEGVTIIDVKLSVKKYDSEVVNLRKIQPTGKTIYDLLRERSLNPTDMTAAPSSSAGTGFTDVPANSPFKDAIAWAVEKKVTAGTSKTTFGPANPCTQNHILTFLWRANGSPAAEGANDFAKAAAWAASKGLLDGGSFDGTKACTRSETMVYLWTLAGRPATAANDTFNDVAADASYAQAVAWAVAQGITSGTSKTTFSPNTVCTRGQIVTFLHRAVGK